LSTGSSQNNRLANTRERDFSIGLDNHGKRYFDPEIGRYISPDPAGFPDGLNNYLYCGNNPINRIDPQGLGWFSDVWDSAVQKFDAGLQTAANFSAGMADKLTGGATQVIRKKLNVDQVDYESKSYKRGGKTGAGLDLALSATGAAGAVKAVLKTAGKTLIEQGVKAGAKELAENCAGQYVKNEVKGAIQEKAVEVAAEGLERAGIMDKETTQAVVGVAQTGIGLATELQNGGLESCFTAGTPVATAPGSANIEQIQVGHRVLTASVESQQSGTAIDPATWNAITLRVESEDQPGHFYDVELLRPLSWTVNEGVHVGGFVPFEVTEMGVKGQGEVLAVKPCPTIESGPGRVVMMTISHLNCAVLELNIEGEDRPLETTVYHPFYSETRNAWVKAGQLEYGETLCTQTGSARLLSIQPKPGVYRVYNLEVEADHVYYVGAQRTLVHNGCGKDKGAKARTADARAAGTPRSTLPRDQSGKFLPAQEAGGRAHTTLGKREGRRGTYTQGATFNDKGQFQGVTDVTDHGRGHPSPHWHPATSESSIKHGPHPLPDPEEVSHGK